MVFASILTMLKRHDSSVNLCCIWVASFKICFTNIDKIYSIPASLTSVRWFINGQFCFYTIAYYFCKCFVHVSSSHIALFYFAYFLCCTLFHISFLWSCQTFLCFPIIMLHSFLVTNSSYCIFLIFHSFHVTFFFMLHCFHV